MTDTPALLVKKNQERMILTPLSPEWKTFQGMMHSHLNLQDATLWGDITIISSCESTMEITTNVLRAHFPHVDITETLVYFKKSGWNCDCQVYLDSQGYLGAEGA